METSKILAGLFLTVSEVYGHSWLHCSKYHATITGQDFDEAECTGYIREWGTTWGGASFAADRGINYFGGDGAWCQEATTFSTPIKNMYSDAYPYAEYYTGETVRLVWPAKNHANYGCFANIPDSSMKLYYNPTVNQSSDLSSLSDWHVFYDFQSGCTAGTDGCGFQNCPKFCDDTDGAPCYGDVPIDASLINGKGFYTFMWYWIFNGGSAPYTTCYEAFVHTDGSDADETETPSPTSEAGSGGGPATVDYLVQVPVCVNGSSYDEDLLETGANSAFTDSDGVSFSVINYVILTADRFNATIQTNTQDASLITGAALGDSEDLCTGIESQFSGSHCFICDEGAIKVFSFGTSTVSGNSDGEAAIVILWAVVLAIVVILLVAGVCFYLQKSGYIVCTENSIEWRGANGAIGKGAPVPRSSHTATSMVGAGSGTATNIVAADDDNNGATNTHRRAVPSASVQAKPRGPPPVPTV